MTDEHPNLAGGFRAEPGAADPRALFAMLDAQAAHPAIVALRERACAMLAVTPGMRVLEVGSGTGDVTRSLARAASPGGSAVGVDPNGMMVIEAIRREQADPSGAAFTVGDATRLGWSDGAFDAVWCERVLQHLDDPATAVTEMARVVRPGGRIVLLDTDWESAVIDHPDPDVVALLRSSAGPAASPWAGRALARMLSAAGANDIDVEGEVLLLRAWRPYENMPPMAVLAMQRMVEGGATTRERADAILRDLKAMADAGTMLMSVPMYCAAGTVGDGSR